jgi:hypothetical protein
MINDSTQYIARISYGKDSLKMLEVIKSRGLPLDRITTTDVWATDTISANLPPMMAFKDRMDQRIWDMYRIEVEHLCALNKDGSKRTYEQMFYHIPVRRSQIGNVERERERAGATPSSYRIQGSITGFPPNTGYNWCQKLKLSNLGEDQRMATQQQDSAMVSTSQEQSKDPMDSQCRYLHGVGNSKSTRSRHPLCGAPHEAQRQKYRGIAGHCCR